MLFKNSATARRRGNLHLALASASLAALIAPSAAWAQEAPADEAVAEEGDEIIVRARRSDERLQDIPVSVQVLSGDRLQDLAIT